MLYYSPFDIYYVVLVVPAMLFALLCQWRVSSSFKKYAKIRTKSGCTGAQVAEKVCAYGDAHNVFIMPVPGHLTDHYNPKDNTIGLSESVHSQATIAAAGVAAHEAGHATQYAQGYGPVRLRSVLYPVSKFGSMMAIPLVVIGFAVEFFMLINIGIAFFAVALFFQIVTLPVEFNASRRALYALQSGGMLDKDELKGAKKVLNAAAMTYVASMAVSLAQLLRLVLIARGRRR
jgi:hypothetical protein